MEVEEGEVYSVNKETLVTSDLLSQRNIGGSKNELDPGNSNGLKEDKTKKKTDSKEELEDSKKSRKKSKQKGSERRKSKDSSPSRSRSRKKSHRRSRSFSKKTKSHRKKSKSKSKSREKRRKRSRSRSKDNRKDRKDRDLKRRSRSRERDHKRRSRSRGRNDERRTKNENASSGNGERESKGEVKDKSKQIAKHEEKKDLTMELESANMAAINIADSGIMIEEEDEEKIALRRRLERLAYFEKINQSKSLEAQSSNQNQTAIIKDDSSKYNEQNKRQFPSSNTAIIEEVTEPSVKDLKQEVNPDTNNVSALNQPEITAVQNIDLIEEKLIKLETLTNVEQVNLVQETFHENATHKHHVDKEKYNKMIESLREQLQKEEDDEQENCRNEQDVREQDGPVLNEQNEDFDMFCETPEFVDAEKTNTTITNVHDQTYDDENGYYRGQIGEVIMERYRVLARLGKGVFGNVFKCFDSLTTNEVAIKVVKSEEIYMLSGLKEREMLRILNEADRHNKRHIIRLTDSFEYRKHLVLVFEIMEMDLRSAIKTFGKKIGLSLESVRSYARQLFIALAHLKENKIIHADLKPDNILVTNNKKTLKLADFGSAFTTEENTITPYLVARYYRAPEIILGCAYDTAVDTWSAACTIFELYTGKILFPGRDNNEMLKLILQTKGKFNNKF